MLTSTCTQKTKKRTTSESKTLEQLILKECSVMLVFLPENEVRTTKSTSVEKQDCKETPLKECSVMLERLPENTFRSAQVNLLTDRNVQGTSAACQMEIEYRPEPSEGESSTSEVYTDDEDMDDPAAAIVNERRTQIQVTQLPALSRTGRHLAPPTSHNRSRLFATQRPHGQSSQYRCFAWRLEGEVPEEVVHP